MNLSHKIQDDIFNPLAEVATNENIKTKQNKNTNEKYRHNNPYIVFTLTQYILLLLSVFFLQLL